MIMERDDSVLCQMTDPPSLMTKTSLVTRKKCWDTFLQTTDTLKGQFTPKSKIQIFPLICSAIYQSR